MREYLLCLLAAANAESPAMPEPSLEPGETAIVGEIVVLGRRTAPHDRTLGVGAVTERMSPSSRSAVSSNLSPESKSPG